MTTITPAHAARLWDDLRDALVAVDRKIVEIIEAEAWEPLGYPSFAAAWADRMQGVRLATDAMKAHVVYALYDSGLNDEEVGEALGLGSGVGPTTQARIAEQRRNGVPAEAADIRVRSHLRRRRSAPQTIHVEVSEDDYAAWAAVAKKHDSDLKKEAEKALRTHFEFLAQFGPAL